MIRNNGGIFPRFFRRSVTPRPPHRVESPRLNGSAPPAKAAAGAGREPTRAERTAVTRRIHKITDQLAKLERQVTARKRALPLFRAARGSDGLIDELRTQRDHPVHTLLRRMYHEKGSLARGSEEGEEG